ESVLANLTSKDPELWAAEWSRVAKPYEKAGRQHEQAGRLEEARAAYILAYTHYATGRYPVPHTPGKMKRQPTALEVYERAGSDRKSTPNASAWSGGVSVVIGRRRWLSSRRSGSASPWFGVAACTISFRKIGSGSRPTRKAISWIMISLAVWFSASGLSTSLPKFSRRCRSKPKAGWKKPPVRC